MAAYDPAKLKFLTECYEKAASLTTKWNALNEHRMRECAVLNREEKGYREVDVLKTVFENGLPTITQDHETAGLNRRRVPKSDNDHILGKKQISKNQSLTDIGIVDPVEDPRFPRPDTDSPLGPLMRPVPAEQHELLHQKRGSRCKQNYLRERYKIPPKKKYYFPETSSMEYGWGLEEGAILKNKNNYHRVWKFRREIQCHSGPQPDPVHYKDSILPGPSKCFK